jgi:hypothetical protein
MWGYEKAGRCSFSVNKIDILLIIKRAQFIWKTLLHYWGKKRAYWGKCPSSYIVKKMPCWLAMLKIFCPMILIAIFNEVIFETILCSCHSTGIQICTNPLWFKGIQAIDIEVLINKLRLLRSKRHKTKNIENRLIYIEGDTILFSIVEKTKGLNWNI